MNDLAKFMVEQSAGYGIFCLLFTVLLGFVLWDSHRREIRWENRENDYLKMFENFKIELQKITDCLNRLLNK